MNDSHPTLPTDQLQPNPFQPRSQIERENLEDLAQSVRAHGILEPLVIAQTPAGYQIIAGERRWRAAKLVGLTEVPVIIKKTTPKGMLEMALVENVQRVNLSPMERAQAFQQLMRDFGYGPGKIAEQIGKSGPYVSNTLRLLELPDAIKDGLVSGAISEGHAKALLSIPTQASMLECYKILLKEGASVRRAEELSRRYRDRVRLELDRRSTRSVDNQLKSWQQQISQAFRQKAEVKLSRSTRQTKITISLKGSEEETQLDLEKILKLGSREE